MKKMLALVLALAMCLGCVALAEETAMVYALGAPLPDFTFTDINGVSHTLSETLKEKEMVLINLWATWCGPCESEFPFLEEAYEQYKDKVEVFALSIDENDDDAKLTEYVASHGLTFPVGHETFNLFAGFGLNGVPTSIVVDRFGNVAFIATGSQPSTDAFVRLFGLFIGDEYTQTNVLAFLPGEKPSIPPTDEAELNFALNVEGTAAPLSFTNSTDEYTWPMAVAVKDDRTVLASTNTGKDTSSASVLTTVEAKAGDVFAFDYKTSTEAGCDLFYLSVNGQTVKAFGGVKEWATYGYEFPADGTYEIALSYIKDYYQAANEDMIWLDNARVVNGEEAAAVLANNPVYPEGTKMTTLSFVGDNVKQVFFTDPEFALMSTFGVANYYVIDNTESATVKVTLAKGLDPEMFAIGCEAAPENYALTDYMTEDGYVIPNQPIDTNQASGYPYTTYFVVKAGAENVETSAIAIADEPNANAFVAMLQQYGINVTGWKYADGTLPSTDEVAEAPELPMEGMMASYTIKCVDQDGNPVTGTMINVCTDETCTPMPVDENGVLEFTLPAYPYVLHVLVVPEGYEFDTTVEEIAPEEGGEVVFTFQKV